MSTPDLTQTEKNFLVRDITKKAISQNKSFVPIKEGELKGRVAMVNIDPKTRKDIRKKISEEEPLPGLEKQKNPINNIDVHFSFDDYRSNFIDKSSKITEQLKQNPKNTEPIKDLAKKVQSQVILLKRDELKKIQSGKLKPRKQIQQFAEEVKVKNRLRVSLGKGKQIEKAEDRLLWAASLDPGQWAATLVNQIPVVERIVRDAPGGAPSRVEMLRQAFTNSFSDTFNALWKDAKAAGEGDLSAKNTAQLAHQIVGGFGQAFVMRGTATANLVREGVNNAINAGRLLQENLTRMAPGKEPLTERGERSLLNSWNADWDKFYQRKNQKADDLTATDNTTIDPWLKRATANTVEDWAIRNGLKEGPKTAEFGTINPFVRGVRALKQISPETDGFSAAFREEAGDILAEGLSGAAAPGSLALTAGAGLFIGATEAFTEPIAMAAKAVGDEEAAKEWSNVVRSKDFVKSLGKSLVEFNADEPDKPAFESLVGFGADFALDPLLVSGLLRPRGPLKGKIEVFEKTKNGNFNRVKSHYNKLGKAMKKIHEFYGATEPIGTASAKLGKQMVRWGVDGVKKAGKNIPQWSRQLWSILKEGPSVGKFWKLWKTEKGRKAAERKVANEMDISVDSLRANVSDVQVEGRRSSLDFSETEPPVPMKRRIRVGKKMMERINNQTEILGKLDEFLARNENFREAIEVLPDLRTENFFKVIKHHVDPANAPEPVQRAYIDAFKKMKNIGNAELEQLSKMMGKMDKTLPKDVRDMVSQFRESKIPDIREKIREGENEAAGQLIRRVDKQNPFNKDLENLSTDMLQLADASPTPPSFNLNRKGSLRDLYMQKLADRFGGDITGRRQVTTQLSDRIIDTLVQPEVASRIKPNIRNMVESGAEKLTRGTLVDKAERRTKVAKEWINKNFTKKGKEVLNEFVFRKTDKSAAKHLSDQLLDADRKVQNKGEIKFKDPFRQQDSTFGPEGGNIVWERMRPFRDLFNTAKNNQVLAKRMKTTSLNKSMQALAESFPDLKGKELSTKEATKDLVSGLVFNELPNRELAQTIRSNIETEIKRKVDRPVENMKIYTKNADIMGQLLKENLTEKGEQILPGQALSRPDATEVTRRLLENNPNTPEQLTQKLSTLKKEELIESNPEHLLKEFESRLLDRIKGNDPNKSNPTYGEYFRDPGKFDREPGTGLSSPEMADLREYQARQKNTTEKGITPEQERNAVESFIRDNLGHVTHKDVVSDIMSDIGNNVTNVRKRLGLFDIFSKHPEWKEVLKGIEDPTAKQVVGELIDNNMLDVIKKVDEEPTVDAFVKMRKGVISNLPPAEAKTYTTQVLAGVPHNRAMRNSIKALNKRLAEEAPKRFDAIDKIAFLERLKEKRPEMTDSLSQAQDMIREHIFEEYNREAVDVVKRDKKKQNFENIKEVVDSLEMLPQEVFDKVRNKVNRGEIDLTQTYLDWIEKLSEKNDVPLSDVDAFARDFFGKKLHKLNDTEFPEVIDWIKSEDRATYTPQNTATPTRRMLRLYQELGMDWFDPKTLTDVSQNLNAEAILENVNKSKRRAKMRKRIRGEQERIMKEMDQKIDEAKKSEDIDESISHWDTLTSNFTSSIKNTLNKIGEEGKTVRKRVEFQLTRKDQLAAPLTRRILSFKNELVARGLDTPEFKQMYRQSIEGVKDQQLLKEKREETGNENWGTPKERFESAKKLAEEIGGEEARDAYVRIRNNNIEMLEKMGDQAEDAQIMVTDLDQDGNPTKRTFKKRKNFFPHPQEKGTWTNKRGLEYLRKELKEMDLEFEKAEKGIQEIVDSVESDVHGSLDYARIKEDSATRIKDPWRAQLIYINDWARKMSERQAFGQNNALLKRDLAEIAKEHGTEVAEYAKNLTQISIRGHDLSNIDQLVSFPSRALQMMNLMMKLDLATINNSTQSIASSLLATDYPQSIMQGIAEVSKNSNARDKIANSGVGIETYMRELGQRNMGPVFNSLFRYNMFSFSASELIQRKFAAGIGLMNARHLLNDLKKLVKDGKGRENPEVRDLISRLDKTGLFDGFESSGAGVKKIKFDAIEAAKRGHFTEMEKSMIMNNYVNRTQFRRRNFDVPIKWNKPIGSFFTQYSHFPFNFLKLIKDETLGEFNRQFKARTGKEFEGMLSGDVFRKEFAQSLKDPARAMGSFLAFGLPLGMLIRNARAVAAGRDDELYSEGAFSYLSAIGGAGYAENFINAFAFEDEPRKAFLQQLGPSVGEMGDTVDAVKHRGIDGLETKMSKSLVQLLAPGGQLLTNRLFKGPNRIQNKEEFFDKFPQALESVFTLSPSKFPDTGDRGEVPKPDKGIAGTYNEFIEIFLRGLNSIYNQGIEGVNELTPLDIEEFTTRQQRQEEREEAESEPLPQ